MANTLDVRLRVIGLGDCMKAMRKASPTAAKEIAAQLRSAANIVVKDARGRVGSMKHASGWRTVEASHRSPWQHRELSRGGKGWPAWQPSEIKRQIKVRSRRTKTRSVGRGEKFRTALAVVSNSPAGAILEFAKKSHASKDFPYVNSLPFVKALGDSSGGRLAWAAFDRNKREVQASVLKAVKMLEASTNAAVASAKDVM